MKNTLNYTQFPHHSLIGKPFITVPTNKIKIKTLGLQVNKTPILANDEIAVVFDYNTPSGLVNQDNYWIYGIITEAKGYSKANDKRTKTATLLNKPFFVLPGTQTYSYIAEGDTDFHIQHGTLLDGTTFKCQNAKVRLIQFIKEN